jgi:predicted RNA-binding protein with RPS1 domain
MENPEIIEIINNLKGRRNYEERKATKLGFNSLYAYFEDKISKQKKAIKDNEKKKLELIRTKNTSALKKGIKTKSCGCC